MELYQRIEVIIKHFGLSNSEFAKKVGIKPSTFNGYLNNVGQKKIRVSQLNQILKAFPKIRKEWLFFGEGPMLKNENAVKEESEPYQASQTEMTSELSSEFLAQAHLVEVVTKKLKEANAPDEVIQQAILAIVAPDVKCKKTEDKKIGQNENCA